jgi:hypothetical protein
VYLPLARLVNIDGVKYARACERDDLGRIRDRAANLKN